MDKASRWTFAFFEIILILIGPLHECNIILFSIKIRREIHNCAMESPPSFIAESQLNAPRIIQCCSVYYVQKI